MFRDAYLSAICLCFLNSGYVPLQCRIRITLGMGVDWFARNRGAVLLAPTALGARAHNNVCANIFNKVQM